MVSRILVFGFAAALALVTMVAISSVPASAIPPASPSLAAPMKGSLIERVCWQERHPGLCWFNHGYCWPSWRGWHCG